MRRAFRATCNSGTGAGRRTNDGVQARAFTLHVESGAILEEDKATKIIKKMDKKDPGPREQWVNNGLAYLATIPGRCCCVNGCGGKAFYMIGKVFFCYKHKDQAVAHRIAVTRYLGYGA